MMKAIRIHEYGDRNVLRYEECTVPQMLDDEILIKVIATAINPIDWKVRQGLLKDIDPHDFPLILGWDFAGVVENIGNDVTTFSPGDCVYARPDSTRNGSYAEYIAVRANEIAPKPKTISFVDAAALPLASIAAWESVVQCGEIGEEKSILIHGAAGGVGSIAVQLAKWKGAHIIATTSEDSRELVESLGADEIIDYKSVNFADVVHDVDVVFDTIGGQVQEDSWAVLRPGGLLVSIVQPPAQERASQSGLQGKFVRIQPNAPILKELATLVDTGVVRPIVGTEFSLKDIAKAHALGESGRARGKTVIHVGTP
jgi:NADPH:quinone reductase-like Zn-dependent oxidoreductase